MNKEVYCSNCETDNKTQPNFDCIKCCCYVCKYKKCKCSDKRLSSIITNDRRGIKSPTDNLKKCEKCKTIVNSSDSHKCYLCVKCNNYSSLENCNCKCCWLCNKYLKNVSSYKTFFQGDMDYCYDCYTKYVCKCDKLFVEGKTCFSCAKMYEE